MIITADGIKTDELQEYLIPLKIVEGYGIKSAEKLMNINASGVSLQEGNCAVFIEKGSRIILDFGKEICGGIRLITGFSEENAKWRITFGESLTEACSSIGYKNATNDHSPRDIEVYVSQLSDLQFGQTGFRFVRLELIAGKNVSVTNIFAVSHMPIFEKEAKIITEDGLLNRIINTAIYTLKLNFQNGYIWDGIKRDRLVWCGDLHPEIITAVYAFGDNNAIKRSLCFLKETNPVNKWMNGIPSYSAWWVINLCDYCRLTGNYEFFIRNKSYALAIISHINSCIDKLGNINFNSNNTMEFFLDWSTRDTEDAIIGVKALLCIMAKKYLSVEKNEDCLCILEKLNSALCSKANMKPALSFQILAGKKINADDRRTLENGGARGFSTFMAYYILKALASSGSNNMINIIKEFYGGMLLKGATAFWEDFDIDWLENSCGIDEFPKEGEADIHGDFGKHCYKQFRHSLCHGWSAGVVAFIVEYILGIRIETCQ